MPLVHVKTPYHDSFLHASRLRGDKLAPATAGGWRVLNKRLDFVIFIPN